MNESEQQKQIELDMAMNAPHPLFVVDSILKSKTDSSSTTISFGFTGTGKISPVCALNLSNEFLLQLIDVLKTQLKNQAEKIVQANREIEQKLKNL